MADNDTRNTPRNSDGPRKDAISKTPSGKNLRPGNSGDKRRGARVSRSAPPHQARVLAMQALYEDDLTEHGLDDILQHMGEQERKEHGDYYARLRAESRRAVGEIGFLARNADSDAAGPALSRFHDATESLLGNLFAAPESDTEEGELPDESVSRYRSGVERALKAVLVTYRDSVERFLSNAAAANRDDGDEPGGNDLSSLEAEAMRALENTLAREERASRETFMDLMSRTVKLARGVEAHKTDIDPHIEKAAPAFPIPQLASIDRVVLRIAVYELLFEPQVPFKAAVNEGVEIAKEYGGPNSGRFVNGVLRTISEGLPKSRKEEGPSR